MKLLHRYLLLEIFPPLVLGAALLTFVMMMSSQFDLVERFVTWGIGPFQAIQILFCLLPQLLILTTPIAFVLACLLAYGRLSEEQEIAAMRAGGFRFGALLTPALLMAAGVGLFLYAFTTVISPSGLRVLERNLLNIVNQTSFIEIFPEGEFSSPFGQDLMIRVKRVREEDQELHGLYVYRMNRGPDDEIESIMTAPVADVRYEPETYEILLTMHDATLYESPSINGAEQASATYTLTEFQRCELRIPIQEYVADAVQSKYPLARLTNANLREDIRQLRQGAAPPPGVSAEQQIRLIHEELASRQSWSVSPLVLVLVAVPVGLMMRTGRKSTAFVYCLVILAVYYGLVAVFTPYAEFGNGSPYLFLHLPNLIIGGLGLVMCRFMGRQ